MSDSESPELHDEPLHARTSQADRVHQLRESPMTLEEFGGLSDGYRDIVGRLKAPSRNGAEPLYGGNPKVVLYLWGDERRAVRLFIEENEEYVEACLRKGNNEYNMLSKYWGDGLYQLFKEEWQFREAVDE